MKILYIHIFWANLVPKYEVLQINWNFGEVLHFRYGMIRESVSYDSQLLKRLSFIFGVFLFTFSLSAFSTIHQRSNKLNYIWSEVYLEPSQTSRMELFPKIVKGINFYPRKLHLGCLVGFRIRLWLFDLMKVTLSHFHTIQLIFICSNSATETLEKGVKYVQS